MTNLVYLGNTTNVSVVVSFPEVQIILWSDELVHRRLVFLLSHRRSYFLEMFEKAKLSFWCRVERAERKVVGRGRARDNDRGKKLSWEVAAHLCQYILHVWLCWVAHLEKHRKWISMSPCITKICPLLAETGVDANVPQQQLLDKNDSSRPIVSRFS